MASLADVSERLMQRYEHRLPLDLVSEVVRGVASESGRCDRERVAPEVERVAQIRLERLLRARFPRRREPS
jgi:hypothetical protein